MRPPHDQILVDRTNTRSGFGGNADGLAFPFRARKAPEVDHAVTDGNVQGIVSRANLIQAVASMGKVLDLPTSDASIRDRLLAHLKEQSWAHSRTSETRR